MPYNPYGKADKAAYDVETKGERLVIEYLNIDIFDVQEMPIDLYLYFLKEAYIYKLMQSTDGREYLDDCKRMEQTKPDRKKIHEQIAAQGKGAS